MDYGTAISEVLTEEYPCKLIKMGIKDRFGKSGSAKELLKYFGLLAENIMNEIKDWQNKKIMLIWIM